MKFFDKKNMISALVTLLLPAAALAMTAPVCKCGPVTPQSYTWNFSKEATGLLSQMHIDAYHAENLADRIVSFRGERTLMGWREDAGLLTREKYWDNKMDTTLCRLRLIKRVLPPGQQAEINKLAPAAIEVSDTTQATIHFLNHHEDQLWRPSYTGLTEDIAQEAGRVEAATAYPNRYLVANHEAQPGARQNNQSGS